MNILFELFALLLGSSPKSRCTFIAPFATGDSPGPALCPIADPPLRYSLGLCLVLANNSELHPVLVQDSRPIDKARLAGDRLINKAKFGRIFESALVRELHLY